MVTAQHLSNFAQTVVDFVPLGVQVRVHLSQHLARVGEQASHRRDLFAESSDGRLFRGKVLVDTFVYLVSDSRFHVLLVCRGHLELLSSLREFANLADSAPLASEQCGRERYEPLQVVLYAEGSRLSPRNFLVEGAVHASLRVGRERPNSDSQKLLALLHIEDEYAQVLRELGELLRSVVQVAAYANESERKDDGNARGARLGVYLRVALVEKAGCLQTRDRRVGIDYAVRLLIALYTVQQCGHPLSDKGVLVLSGIPTEAAVHHTFGCCLVLAHRVGPPVRGNAHHLESERKGEAPFALDHELILVDGFRRLRHIAADLISVR